MNFDILRDYLDTMKHTPYSETYVMQDHEVLFHHRAGIDDIETGARCKPNGFYYIYSCSKVLTCTAALFGISPHLCRRAGQGSQDRRASCPQAADADH